MKLENEFVVATPVGDVWDTLLDLERVAGCLPGATIAPGEEPDMFLGSMRVKLGPVTMDYEGTAKLGFVDAAARTAVFTVQGKETRGQGTASATITNRLLEVDGSTKVVVETKLSVTGRAAQFGRGIMQDVAAAMLKDFSSCLSQMMEEGGGDPAASAADLAAPAAPTATAQQPEALKVGGILGRVVLDRLRRLLAPFRRH